MTAGRPAINEHIRARLKAAVDALCDDELHQRLWLHGERLSPDELTFDDAVLFVIDELSASDPTELVGHFLMDERELAAFLYLSHALELLVASIGEDGTFADAVTSGSPWQQCVDAARSVQGLLDD
jgi:hypothetical protein